MTDQGKSAHVVWINQGLHSAFIVVAGILFIICLALIMLGLVELVRGLAVMFGGSDLSVMGQTTSSVFITSLGLIVIGIAVLDLTRSIMDEELSEMKVKNVHERARDFLTRFLPVIIFAISAEVFVKMAQTDMATHPSIFGDLAMLGIGVGAMLAGLAVYIRMSSKEEKGSLPRIVSSP